MQSQRLYSSCPEAPLSTLKLPKISRRSSCCSANDNVSETDLKWQPAVLACRRFAIGYDSDDDSSKWNPGDHGSLPSSTGDNDTNDPLPCDDVCSEYQDADWTSFLTLRSIISDDITIHDRPF